MRHMSYDYTGYGRGELLMKLKDYMVKPKGKNKRFTWSYSRWANWKACPLKFHLSVWRKEFGLAPFKSSPAIERGIRIHNLAEQYVRGNIQGIPREFADWHTEFNALKNEGASVEEDWWFDNKWIKVPHLDWNNVWLMAKSDAYMELDEDELLVVDHKTGGIYASHSDQAELYATAALSIFDTVDTVQVEFWYLDKNDIGNYIFERDKLYNLKDKWSTRARKMERQKTFEPTPNSDACRFCDFHIKKGGPCNVGV